ncbi:MULTISPECIES: enolase C-terminal domain-like protein [unclassified Mesorhizobium]|uniref:enolase C-terminal domain-like protein n=1 Tax=unclassified Mesorhizobium TaxID=325217 RepID=UPI001128ACE8|nr:MULTISPECIES: enolase C-terminal domain-like protein [unclassified Mesorhizobium]MBZ9894359.1 L-rhamnonate dehydratase [Mesorhizobium sp. BR1-1-6]TPM57682.1 L-rhamnonate dehydratase [Mesorhizobium sp. B2-2-4]TPM65515.1 L-rhamnonate dehydratase [Mesorhizobium sp. B2-2-1]TPN38575.1 L-rhamnonate dehydratase [Mesorhizobium sp. B1-1-6]TPN71841.1 L-rhamnonate dehydratase [Mesorhizobium sp. B1-1-3]
MRILDVRSYIAPPPRGSWLNEIRVSTPMSAYPEYGGKRGGWRGPNAQDVFIEIIADDGLTGVGMTRGGAIVETIVAQHLKGLLVGKDPRNIEMLWDQMYLSTLAYGRKGAPVMALSGIDLALWDLLGKWMGQPLYRILGGEMRASLPCYATHPDSDALVKEGYIGTKLPMAYGPPDGKEGLRRNVERVAEVRETVGPDIDIMVDCWMSWTVDYTLEFARAAAEYRVRWIEEPLLPDDLDGHVELRRRLNGPLVATGEHEYTRWGFRDLIERGCADILQPDVAWCGGITEIRRVAAMASSHGIPVIPHNGVLQPWATHLMMATPNCPLAEYLVFYGPNDEAPPPLMLGELKPENGRVRPSEQPGAGIEFDHEEWRRQTAARSGA